MNYLLKKVAIVDLKDLIELELLVVVVVETIVVDNCLFLFVEYPMNNIAVVMVVVDNNLLEFVVDNGHLYRLEKIIQLKFLNKV